MDTNEPFCMACLAVPFAFAGAGTSAYGAKGNHRKKKKIVFWIGVSLTLISLLIALYYLFIAKCSECENIN